MIGSKKHKYQNNPPEDHNDSDDAMIKEMEIVSAKTTMMITTPTTIIVITRVKINYSPVITCVNYHCVTMGTTTNILLVITSNCLQTKPLSDKRRQAT